MDRRFRRYWGIGKLRKDKSWLFALFLACCIAHAQELGLGSTSDDVHRVLGSPTGYSADGIIRATPPTWNRDNVVELYTLRPSGVEVELRVAYFMDATSSRLHPAFRVKDMIYRFDKPVPLRTALDEVPGASRLCQPYCDIRRLIPGREILLTQKGSTGFTKGYLTPTISGFMTDAQGQEATNSMSNIDSNITVLRLFVMNYSGMPLIRGVKGKWPDEGNASAH